LYLAAMIWSENVSFLALAYFTQDYKQDSRCCIHTCVIITMTARTKYKNLCGRIKITLLVHKRCYF
jgi:hypothetical protein